MHSESDNIEVMAYGHSNEIIDKLFNLLQINIKLVQKLKRGEVILSLIVLIYLLQMFATIALNFDEIKKDFQTVSNIKPIINNFNWEGINYPSKLKIRKDLKKIIDNCS